jgi:hypothetical protein
VGYLIEETLMTLQTGIELLLAVGAAGLLLRDVRRAWRDRLRRPVTLFVAGLMAALLIGVSGGRTHPEPWWLMIPAGILTWEVIRGWRQAPRCHLWEAGVGGFAASLLIAALGLGLGDGSTATVFLATAAGLAIVGVGLLWRSHSREPPPSRANDLSHYERRGIQRPLP